jgi:hypothetical protein
MTNSTDGSRWDELGYAARLIRAGVEPDIAYTASQLIHSRPAPWTPAETAIVKKAWRQCGLNQQHPLLAS